MLIKQSISSKTYIARFYPSRREAELLIQTLRLSCAVFRTPGLKGEPEAARQFGLAHIDAGEREAISLLQLRHARC